MKRRQRFSLALLLLALIGGGAVYVWGRSWVERQMQQMLQQSLGQPVQLSLASVGLERSIIRDVSIGQEHALALPQLTLDYSLNELRQGQLQQLTVASVTIAVQQTPQGWLINGLSLPAGTPTPDPPTYPAQPSVINAIPLGKAQIKQAFVQARGAHWQLNLPFALDWQRAPRPRLDLTSGAAQAKFGPISATAESLALILPYDSAAQSWQGTWRLANVAPAGLPLAVPVLQGQGEIILKPTLLAVLGSFTSADRQWQLQGQFNLPPGGQPQLILRQLQMPAYGGMVKLGQTAITFGGKSAQTLSPDLQHIDLPALLRAVTGKDATGSGTISGTLPVTLLPTGKLRLGPAQLRADAPGTLRLPPELIPGDNPQLILLRDILQDLHYDTLALDLQTGDDGKLQLHFALNGNNPAVQQGKPVKLNIRLGGDVLNLLEQNLRILTNPQQLLPP